MRSTSDISTTQPASSDLAVPRTPAFPNIRKGRTASAGFLMVSFGMALSAVTVIVWVMHSLISVTASHTIKTPKPVKISNTNIPPPPPPPPPRAKVEPPPEFNEPPPMPRMSPGSGPNSIPGIAIPVFTVKDLLPKIDQRLVAITHREVMPLAESQPIFPPRLLERGVEGSCVVNYSISASGVTKDIVVDEKNCSHRSFGQAAAKAVAKYKYAPKIVDGEPVVALNQRQFFRFLIDR